MPHLDQSSVSAEDVTSVIRRIFTTPPLLATAGMPLGHAPVDHVAIAVPSLTALRELSEWFSGHGATILEPVHLWPDDAGCPPGPDDDKKWMTTFVYEEVMTVLLAPHSHDDLIAAFLRRSGGIGAHHVAYSVREVGAALEDCLRVPGVSQISALAVDGSTLSQVFMRTSADICFTELIHRARGFAGTFTCNNIAVLTRGERVALSPAPSVASLV
jgi:hypothetical protein